MCACFESASAVLSNVLGAPRVDTLPFRAIDIGVPIPIQDKIRTSDIFRCCVRLGNPLAIFPRSILFLSRAIQTSWIGFFSRLALFTTIRIIAFVLI